MHTRYLFITVVMVLAACSRNIEPLLPGTPNAPINFYNASELMLSSHNLAINNNIYMDDTVKKYATFSSSANNRQYPVRDPYSAYGLFGWLNIPAGNHRFMFTCYNGFPVADTSFYIPAEQYQTVYLSESPEGDAVYRLLVVPEVRTGDPGKVRIRFVHLSPDAGTLNCYRSLPNDEKLFAGLPQELSYGNATPYVTLDTNGTAATRDNIVLRLVEKNDPDNVVLSTGVPALPGASYVLLLQGFRQKTNRRMHIGKKSDGQFKDTVVDVNPNLRVQVRRTY